MAGRARNSYALQLLYRPQLKTGVEKPPEKGAWKKFFDLELAN